MKFVIPLLGRTREAYLDAGVRDYAGRLGRFAQVELPVHGRAGGALEAGVEVEEGSGDRGRAEIEGDSELAGRVGVVRRLKGGGTDPADNRFLERGSCVSEVFCRIHL